MSLVRILCSCEGRRLTEENDQTPQNADSDRAVSYAISKTNPGPHRGVLSSVAVRHLAVVVIQPGVVQHLLTNEDPESIGQLQVLNKEIMLRL